MTTMKTTIGRIPTKGQRVIIAPCRDCGGTGHIDGPAYVGPCMGCDGDGTRAFSGRDVDVMLAAGELLSKLRGARDMLKESAKQHRLDGEDGHAQLCTRHAESIDAVLAKAEGGAD